MHITGEIFYNRLSEKQTAIFYSFFNVYKQKRSSENLKVISFRGPNMEGVKLESGVQLEISWTPRHADIKLKGNEHADRLAKYFSLENELVGMYVNAFMCHAQILVRKN